MPLTIQLKYIDVFFLPGDTEKQECTANGRAVMPHLHIPRGRTSDVVPVVRAARLHGHVVGLREIPRHCVCSKFLK